MKFSLTRNPTSARSAEAVAHPKPQPPDAVAEAEQRLAALRESFGGVSTELGHIEEELKVATNLLATAKGVSEGERQKLYRSHGPDAAPTQRMVDANSKIPRLEQKIRNLRSERDCLKPILPPQIVAARQVLAQADYSDKREFSNHLSQAFQVLKRIDVRATGFEKLTSHYCALVQNYKFQSLDDANYGNTKKPPYTGSPVWRTAYVQWRRKNPELEKAPGRQWIDGIRSLVEMMKKL